MKHLDQPMTDTGYVNVLGTKLSSRSGPSDKAIAATKLGLLVGVVLVTALCLAFAKSNPIADLYVDSQKREIAKMQEQKCVKTGEQPGDYSHTFIVFQCPDGRTQKVLVTRAN